jgi:hypothetical protein
MEILSHLGETLGELREAGRWELLLIGVKVFIPVQ